MNLIEQLGGYDKSKRELQLKIDNSVLQCCMSVTADMIQDALLEYRRANNIYESGDDIVCLNSRRYKIYKFPSNKDHWLNFEEIRHASPEEIAAGRRL